MGVFENDRCLHEFSHRSRALAKLKQLAQVHRPCVAWRSDPGAARVLAELALVGELTQQHFLRDA